MSKSLFLLTCAFLVTALSCCASTNLMAQAANANSTTIGRVTWDWQHGQFVGNRLALTGGVHMNSALYDLTSYSLTVDLASGQKAKGSLGISKATALGNPAKGSQVIGTFQQVALKRTYKVMGDKAVYVSEPGRTGGGRIDFTGHVTVVGLLPESIQGPAVMRVEHATVSLGPSPKYPSVDFSAGSLKFTPLQQ